VPALLWSLGIFVLSSIPGSAFPELPGWYGARGTLPPGRGAAAQVFVAFFVAALYGATDEAHQAFTPQRSPDLYDVLADAVGGLSGALACVAIVARRRKRA